MAFEEEGKFDSFGCGMLCSTKERYERLLEDLSHIIERKDIEIKRKEYIIEEKDKEIMAIKAIQDNLETMKIRKEVLISIFDDLLNDIHPFYNFLNNKARSNEEITAILVCKEEDFYDIWFIIDESNFLLESKISEIFCDLVKKFSDLLFDILIIPKKKVNLEILGKKGFKAIYKRN